MTPHAATDAWLGLLRQADTVDGIHALLGTLDIDDLDIILTIAAHTTRELLERLAMTDEWVDCLQAANDQAT